jgi:hypothetical protein
VRGRTRAGNRVKYRIDPTGRDEELAVPERVVLSRWRRRRTEKLRARKGARLFPSTWRALGVVLPTDESEWRGLTVEDLRDLRARSQAKQRRRQLRAPAAEVILAMIRIRSVGPDRIRQLIERHTVSSAVDPRRPGVPDLFLWAEDQRGSLCAPRFVEVKRPDERLAAHQRAELEFMRSLGLQAGVFRLIER